MRVAKTSAAFGRFRRAEPEPALPLGLALLACAVVAACIPGVTGCASQREPPTVPQLARILHHARIVEPMLSGGLAFSPCQSLATSGRLLVRTECSPLPRRGSSEAKDLARFTASVTAWAHRSPSAATLQAGGLAFLVQGQSAKLLDHAVELLSRAAALAPRDATIASDLAAAYLVRAEREDSPRDLVIALARSHDALSLDPALPAARFNLALARGKLHLGIGAAAALQAYLQLDAHSGWAHEAADHLATLRTQSAIELWPVARESLRKAAAIGNDAVVREVSRHFSQAVRLYVWEETLPDWAEFHAAGHEVEAKHALDLSRRLGQAVTAIGGDSLIEETVASIAAAYEQPGSPRLAPLASGLREYRLGVRAYEKNAMTESAAHFRAAVVALHRGSSPFASAAEISLAVASYQQEDYRTAMDRLRRVASDSAQRTHFSLLGRAAWIEGLCNAALGQPIETIAAYERALGEFTTSREVESAVAVHSMLANALGAVGEKGRAWVHRIAALGGASELRSLRRRHALFGSAAIAVLDLGLPAAARDFQDEAVAWALQSANPLDIAEELRARAAVELKLGNVNQALDDLHRALALGLQLEESLRNAVLGEIDDVEASSLRERDPEKAIQLQRAAIEMFRRTGYRGRLAGGYLDLALAELAQDATGEAEKSLRSGITVQEQEWLNIMRHLDERADKGAWTDYFEQRRALFDQLIQLQAREARLADAFDSSERSRSWEVLLQLLALPSLPRGIGRHVVDLHREPRRLSALQQALAPDTVLVEYRVLEDQVLCWVVRREGVRLHTIALGRAAVHSLVARLHAIITQGRPEGELLENLAALHSALLVSARRDLRPGDELIFIPDRSLSSVPFSSLWDAKARRFLMEDFAVGIAPSADLYVSAVAHDRELRALIPQTALVVRNPSYRRELFTDLAPLAGAEDEGAGVAALYPDTELLSGIAATKDRVVNSFGRHAVVHFSGHSVALGENQLVSVIPLAPAGEADSGILYAYELLGRSFPRTRLVVLASCATVGEPGPDFERISGFVRPLLGDGVPAVIASLWPVDDRATAELLGRFHQRFRAGDDAPHALRSAQLAMLHRRPEKLAMSALWAGFEVFGGSAGMR